MIPPMVIDDLWQHWGADLARVEERINDLVTSAAPITAQVGRHLVGGGGKRIRPLLVVLSARAHGYRGADDATLGAVIEAIHTASLLHDDVVDGATVRRGRPTAHSLWGSQVTVLVGDFLYSNALKESVLLGNQRVMEILSDATTRMTEGELFQLGKIGDTDITVEDYVKIVQAKTAALISAACRLGPVLAGRDGAAEDSMAAFGLALGTAFQIVDDVLDYRAEAGALGKALGKDLSEGKITLPLILLLQRADPDERNRVAGILAQEAATDADVAAVVGLLGRYGCLDDALKDAAGRIDAVRGIVGDLEDDASRSALLAVSDYALSRTR